MRPKYYRAYKMNDRRFNFHFWHNDIWTAHLHDKRICKYQSIRTLLFQDYNCNIENFK